MYAVTGATGKLGSQVVAALRGIVAPEEIVALARDPGKAADMTAAGVQVRRFDYDEPGGMKAALADVTRLLFVSSSAPDRLGQHRAVVEAAAQVAPALIAYTSVIHADVNPMPVAESHRETERMIVESGLPQGQTGGPETVAPQVTVTIWLRARKVHRSSGPIPPPRRPT